MMARRMTFGVGLLLAAWTTVGCASERGGDSPAVPLPRITVHRTGGFAGRDDTVSVDPDGTWHAASRAGARTAGTLTPDQLTEIRTLAADPRLAAEAKEAARTKPPTRCRDAFTYRLTVGATAIEYVDCPTDPDQPTASIALTKALIASTISGP